MAEQRTHVDHRKPGPVQQPGALGRRGLHHPWRRRAAAHVPPRLPVVEPHRPRGRRDRRRPADERSIDQMLTAHHADRGGPRRRAALGAGDRPGRRPRRTILVGFDGGDRHDGTFRLRSGRSGHELLVQAFLGDAVLAPGEQRTSTASPSTRTDAPERQARRRGRVSSAGATAPARRRRSRSAGAPGTTTSTTITEADSARNLALAARDWPFDVFQLDDGYQPRSATGSTHQRQVPVAASTPSPRRSAAPAPTPGIWLAPFLAAPDSAVAGAHPDWLARASRRRDPLRRASCNPAWGGRRAARARHDATPTCSPTSRRTRRALVDAGFDYLKLDFIYAPSCRRRLRTTRRRTPAQRVRAGLRRHPPRARATTPSSSAAACRSARRSASSTACASAPTSRRRWDPQPGGCAVPGYDGTLPATRQRLAQHARPRVPAPPPVAQRPRLPDAAHRPRPSSPRTQVRSLGRHRRRVRRHGARLRRPRPARRRRPAAARRGDRPRTPGRRARRSSGSPARCPDLMSVRSRPPRSPGFASRGTRDRGRRRSPSTEQKTRLACPARTTDAGERSRRHQRSSPADRRDPVLRRPTLPGASLPPATS